MSETTFCHKLMLDLMEIGTRVFRNNVGALRDRYGTWVTYGVCNPGGSDLIGWHSIVITPEMVGRKVAVFLAIETKVKKRKATTDQGNFLDNVREAGGIAILARDAESIESTILKVKHWSPNT